MNTLREAASRVASIEAETSISTIFRVFREQQE
jgi:hypothetical protein